jgi:AcrR family transcriptional regulator
MPAQVRRPRVDARRNRERVLAAAASAFAAEGFGVPVHEIARLAGVGTGTVSRHFPTKEALVQAIVADRVERCVHAARELAGSREAGPAFIEYVAYLVEQGAADAGVAGALAGAGFDLEAVAAHCGYDLQATLADLLTAAQRAGAVRPEVRAPDVKALIAGCLAGTDAAARARLLAVVTAGLRPPGEPV